MKVFQAIFLTLIPFTYSKVIRPKDEIQQLLSEFPHMTVPETIKYWGYPMEEHWVITEDGYIIGMHRIPHGVNNFKQSSISKPAVFLNHGLLADSGQWVFGPPKKSLGYILADAGYDVWLGNTRGNTYSRNHTYLDTCSSCPEFWSFGFDDSGLKDYSAEIDYILDKTGQSKVHFVGHSMGTTQLMVLLSDRPEYNDKIHGAYLLAPPIYMTNAYNPIFWLASLGNDIQWLFHLFGQWEFLPSNNLISWLGHYFCDVDDHPILGELCGNIAFIIAGIDESQMNATMVPIYLDHIPSGSSTRPFVHYAQLSLLNREFKKYDFGNADKNIEHYGVPVPPNHDLTNVKVPTALFLADADDLATIADAEWLVEDLPNVSLFKVVDFKGFTHIDFAIAIDADKLVYSTIVDMMNSTP